MQNININLTTEQAKLVDKTTQEKGFSNRSEFFRSLLRYIFVHSPKILTELDAVNFEHPATKNTNKIIADLEASGRYNQAFLDSIAKGLKKSEYFN